jgi:elongation factor 1-gamma
MKAEEAAISALKRALGALNLHLASNTYLVGHSVTLADIILTCNLFLGFAHVMTKSFTSEFPHVERYFWTMINQPNVKKVMGEVKQAEVVVPITKKPGPPKESAKSKAKEEPKKEAKEKEPAKPKAEPAVEEEEAPKPKPKNPLDLLPPSKMILDDWKRLYSNTKTNFREVAIKGISYPFSFDFPPCPFSEQRICYFQIASNL